MPRPDRHPDATETPPPAAARERPTSRPPRPPSTWLSREVLAWAMFDFANQAFTLVILTTMFQIYFVEHLVPAAEGTGEARGRQLWATSGIVSLLIVMVISPLVGALADFSGAKKRLLLGSYLGCVVLTASLALAAPGDVALGMTLFIAGYVFYAVGENFLGAFLPEIAAQRDMGKVSAFGFTLGYAGGLLCLAGAVIVSRLVEGPAGLRLVSVWAAAFFALAALPTFLVLKEKKRREELPAGQSLWTVGFHRLASTFRRVREFDHLFRFLGIMTIYLAGMQIVIWFAATIAKEVFGMSQTQLAVYILILTVTSIAGAAVTGRIQDRIGTRRTIDLALALWLVVMLTVPFVREEWGFMFWVLGSGVGFGMGMLGTASRAMVGLFSPAHKAAEFFGFYGLATKLAAVLGLLLTIAAEEVFPGNYGMVVASSAVFFVAGILLMRTVNEWRGRRVALRAAREHIRTHHDYAGAIENGDPGDPGGDAAPTSPPAPGGASAPDAPDPSDRPPDAGPPPSRE